MRAFPPAALAGLLVLGACACAQRGAQARTVEAEGWAVMDARDPAGTRQRALADAQRRAVEKAAGLSLTARTTVSAAISVKQWITADVRGRIREFKILGELAEQGLLKLRIRAVVLPDPEEKRQAAFSSDLSVAVDAPEAAARPLRQALSERGASLAGRGTNPDLIFRATARTSPLHDTAVRPFSSSRAHLTLEAVERASGAVLWTTTKEISALGVDPDAASRQALSDAGALAGQAAAAEVPDLLRKRF